VAKKSKTNSNKKNCLKLVHNFLYLDEEEDVISTQRIEILKQNEKFMKELKRKMDEIKKARIDA